MAVIPDGRIIEEGQSQGEASRIASYLAIFEAGWYTGGIKDKGRNMGPLAGTRVLDL